MKPLLPIVVVILLLAAAASAAEGDAEKTRLSDKEFEAFIAKMQSVYDAAKTLKSEFEQKYKSSIGRKSASGGRVMFKKPGLMRWTYLEPASKEFISDSKRLWIVDHNERTVMSSEYKEALIPAGVTFLWGEGKLKESFDIKYSPGKENRKESVKMVLIPKKEKGYLKKLVLKVSAKTYLITDALIIDPAGNKNYIKFISMVENERIDDSQFKFTKPPNYNAIKNPMGN